MLTAAELRRRGVARQNAGRFAAGRSLLERALARAEDEATRALVEVSLAYSDAELGTAEEGLARCRTALARQGVPDDVRGLAWAQTGLMHVRTGDARAAMEAFEHADALLPDGADEVRGNVALNRGNVHLQRGEPAKALHDFAAAATHFDVADLQVHREKAVHNRGYARLLMGDIAGALEDMDAARPTLAGLGAMAAAVGEQDRAEALLSAGLLEDAADALRHAVEGFGRVGVRQGRAEALLVLARSQLRDDPAEARRIARRAMRIFAARGSETWANRAEALALAAEAAAERQRPGMVSDIERVEAALRRQGLNHDAALLGLYAARHVLRLGDDGEAVRRLQLVEQRDDEPLDNRLVRQEVKAAVAITRGQAGAALGEVRAGLDELASWQRTFGSLDLQTTFVGHGRRLARTGIGLALDDGRPEVVLEWIDRARSLATRVAPVRAPEDETTAAELARLRMLRADIRGAEEAGQNTAPLLGEHRDLQRRIRERAWRAPGSGQVRETVSLREVHDALAPDDGILVAHVGHAGRAYAFVCDRERADLVELGAIDPVSQRMEGMRADLDVAASDLPHPLGNVVRDGLATRLTELSEALFGAFRDRLGDPARPVVLVPPGALAGTPWTLLPDLAGRAVTVARSVSLWAAARARAWESPRSAVLVAGPNVRRADDEIGRADEWGEAAVRLRGDTATVAAVAAAASRTDVLHLAAHGLHSADNPLFSGVELVDGSWFGYDIDALEQVPSTVLLSACELGRSTVRWGEETIGMTAAWLHAGARTVIAAPAAVNDDVACEVLGATHERLAVGARPAIALRDAVESLGLQESSSFMCFGQGW